MCRFSGAITQRLFDWNFLCNVGEYVVARSKRLATDSFGPTRQQRKSSSKQTAQKLSDSVSSLMVRTHKDPTNTAADGIATSVLLIIVMLHHSRKFF